MERVRFFSQLSSVVFTSNKIHKPETEDKRQQKQSIVPLGSLWPLSLSLNAFVKICGMTMTMPQI